MNVRNFNSLFGDLSEKVEDLSGYIPPVEAIITFEDAFHKILITEDLNE